MSDKIKHLCHFSPCRKYRYALWSIWENSKPYCMFIALNPSKADEIRSDPTVTRCINYAKNWGYGALVMTNIFAYRETNPELMKQQKDPTGKENDKILKEISEGAGLIIAAWGTHGSFLDRGNEVTKSIKKLYCLGINKDGSPKHPLYLKKSVQPFPYELQIKTI